MSQGDLDNADVLLHRRAIIIKKARENVRLSHQRMRNRVRSHKFRV
jgi:hypothetical protein